MSGVEPDPELLSDSALIDPARDQLGYADFARDITTTIQQEVPTDGFVVGIYGEWGSGKSTIMNFIRYEMHQSDTPPITMQFNPWWFSGQTDLIRQFFSQLRAGLDIEGQKFEKVREKLSTYAKAVSKLPLSSLGLPSEKYAEFFSELVQPDTPNVGELKEEIADELRDIENRVVVFIDDIDRLSQEEIRQMFRLIKSVADFPNVIYVVAFDREVVTQALEGEQGFNDGDEYLNKIVQLSQRIPVPKEGALDAFLTDRLSYVLDKGDFEMDPTTWRLLYKNGIRPLVGTPRDAVRLANSVNATSAGIRDELNFADVVGIETLRLFFNDVYEDIRTNPEQFVEYGNKDFSSESVRPDSFSELSVSNQEHVFNILSYLFPRTRDPDDSSLFVESSDTYWEDRRVCHPRMFPYYFRQTVPEGELTTQEFEGILATTTADGEFTDRLRELVQSDDSDTSQKSNTFLKQFDQRVDEIDSESVVIEAFFQVGDRFIGADPTLNQLDVDNQSLLLDIIWNVMEELDANARMSLFESAIGNSESPCLTVASIKRLRREAGLTGSVGLDPEEQLLSSDDVESLTETATDRLRELADSGELGDAPRLDVILPQWNEWTSSADPVDWTEDYIQSTDNVLTLIEAFAHPTIDSTGPLGDDEKFVALDDLEDLVELDAISTKLEDIESEASLTDQERTLIEAFRESKRQHGSDDGVAPDG